MTCPRASPQAVSITRSALSPATNPGPRPIASGARPRSVSGAPCLCTRASTRTSGATAASTSSKGASDTGSAPPQASILAEAGRARRALREHPLQRAVILEEGVGERHAAARVRRAWVVMQDDRVPEGAQPQRDRRADVAGAANEEARHRRSPPSGARRAPRFHRDEAVREIAQLAVEGAFRAGLHRIGEGPDPAPEVLRRAVAS